LELQTI